MMTMMTQDGIRLETLRERERSFAALTLLACMAGLALIGAGALCAACLRGCVAAHAQADAACCEANWSRGIYGDELADWGGASAEGY